MFRSRFQWHFFVFVIGILIITVIVPLIALLHVPTLSHADGPQNTQQKSTTSTTSVGNSISPSGPDQIASPKQVSTDTVKQSYSSVSGAIPVRRGPQSTVNIPVPHTGAVRVTPPHGSKTNTLLNTSFAGQSQTSWSPSDANGTAGPNNFVQTVNEQWAIFDRNNGQQLYSTSFNSWFNQTGSLFDPKVVYDPWGGRFIMQVSTGQALLLSVSKQSSAFGSWCNYSFPTVSSLFADYPDLGVDKNGVYSTANMFFPNNGPYDYVELLRYNRAQLESCQSVSYKSWTNIHNPDGSLAFTIVPSVAYSSATVEYLVESFAGGGCSLVLWKLSSKSLKGYTISTECYTPPPPAEQAGSSGTIETLDSRIYKASYLNGLLDSTLTGSYDWGDGTGTVGIVDWFKIKASTATLSQQGEFGSTGTWNFFPAIQQGSNGNAIIIYNASSATLDPSIWYIGQLANGNLENISSLVYGNSYYGTSGTSRWGDYQSAWLDPTNNTQIWICGQYSSSTNTWGTWIGNTSA